MFEVKDNNFFQEVIKSDKPVVVDFYASWCNPCKLLMPELEELSKNYEGKVKFVKISVEDSPKNAGNFGIMSVPNILLFSNGKIVEQLAGGAAIEKIKEAINEKFAL